MTMELERYGYSLLLLVCYNEDGEDERSLIHDTLLLIDSKLIDLFIPLNTLFIMHSRQEESLPDVG